LSARYVRPEPIARLSTLGLARRKDRVRVGIIQIVGRWVNRIRHSGWTFGG
jgi:hypothetical protein